MNNGHITKLIKDVYAGNRIITKLTQIWVFTANFFHHFSFRSATIRRLKKLQFKTGVSQMNGLSASTLGLL